MSAQRSRQVFDQEHSSAKFTADTRLFLSVPNSGHAQLNATCKRSGGAVSDEKRHAFSGERTASLVNVEINSWRHCERRLPAL